MDGIISISEIRSKARGHFFDPGSMRFFNSRYPQTGYRKGDKAYFITSEQFIGSNGYAAPRMYTIRVIDFTTGDVKSEGQFNEMTKAQAQTTLRHILES